MKLMTNQKIEEVLKNLDSGYVVYISKISGDVLRLPLSEPAFYFDCDDEEKVFSIIEASPDEYLKIENLTESEELELIKKFIRSLVAGFEYERLAKSIERSRPVKSFHTELEFVGTVIKDAWLRYRREWSYEYVTDLCCKNKMG